MKLLICVVLAGLTNAAQPTGDYIKVKFRAAKANATPGNTDSGCTANNVTSTVLVRVPKTLITAATIAADGSLVSMSNDLVGACLSLDAAAASKIDATVKVTSMLFTAMSTANQYIVILNTAPFCTGTFSVPAAATGFEFDANGHDCSGGIATGTPANDDDGLLMIAGGTLGYEAEGMLYTGKKFIALNLQGPFTNALCHTAAANSAKQIPVVIPLETTAAGTDHDVSTIIGDSAHCIDLGASVVAQTSDVVAYKTTSTKGELRINIASGNNVTSFTVDTQACTVNTTASVSYDSLNFIVGLRGDISSGTCLQSASTDGGAVASAGTGRYWNIAVHPMSFGYWPNEVDIPAPAPGSPGAACSPAAGLHTSAFMAACVALMALLM